MAAYIISANNIVLFHNGEVLTKQRNCSQEEAILNAIREGDYDTAARWMTQEKAVAEFVADSDITISNHEVCFRGVPIDNSLTKRIIQMREEGFSIAPMVAFLNNLLKNPSHRAIKELYEFLEKSDLPITDDGHFLAYKRVTFDYKDCHSNTISNRVGDRPKMPRNEVDDDCNNTCSTGLHFASLDYLKHYCGERLMVLKINPENVVSIPADYNATKGRCCEYEVVQELEMPSYFDQLTSRWGSVANPNNEDEEEDDDEDEIENEDDGYLPEETVGGLDTSTDEDGTLCTYDCFGLT